FDAERQAIVAEAYPDLQYKDTTSSSPQINVEIAESETNGYRFKTQSPDKALLVVSQIYYPGWRATVDGERVPVMAADYALTGIPVPGGSHEIRFVFDPASFKIGLAITI